MNGSGTVDGLRAQADTFRRQADAMPPSIRDQLIRAAEALEKRAADLDRAQRNARQ